MILICLVNKNLSNCNHLVEFSRPEDKTLFNRKKYGFKIEPAAVL